MKPEEAAWVAGLLEGEGSFELTDSANRRRLGVVCAMSDRDVVERLLTVVGAGRIYVRTPQPPRGNKTMYAWTLTNRPEVAQLISEIRPFMGERRSAKIDAMLTWNALNPVTKWRYRHGTKAMYASHGCRCERCTAWHEQWKASRRARRVSERKVQPPAHGTNSKYTDGCRCQDCRDAHASYGRRYRAEIPKGETNLEDEASQAEDDAA